MTLRPSVYSSWVFTWTEPRKDSLPADFPVELSPMTPPKPLSTSQTEEEKERQEAMTPDAAYSGKRKLCLTSPTAAAPPPKRVPMPPGLWQASPPHSFSPQEFKENDENLPPHQHHNSSSHPGQYSGGSIMSPTWQDNLLFQTLPVYIHPPMALNPQDTERCRSAYVLRHL